MFDLSSSSSPCASTVICRVRSPFVTAVATSAMLRTCAVSELAIAFTESVSAFQVTARDGVARAGVLRTAHGEVRTPAFMPVGTKATVKTVDPEELRALGAEIVLGNAYHLHFRPGEELIAELGGLHAFMGWDGAILTDSGGFQVFSLRDTLLAADDDGVTLRSVYDGRPERFTPERVVETAKELLA